MEKTRVAIIGTGNISNAHMEGYNSMPDTVELAACCDIDRDKAEAYAKRYGFPKVYTDYNEMLAEVKPDAVSVRRMRRPSPHRQSPASDAASASSARGTPSIRMRPSPRCRPAPTSSVRSRWR